MATTILATLYSDRSQQQQLEERWRRVKNLAESGEDSGYVDPKIARTG